ncbi:hypothetical protein GQ44DRAFT_832706 [Phaeosphaeriaceae sp. PMI808]|nr:hypothetical protein GQ44DRAFT_832706 [Phaeosphaeriaceae sp. PMI808]
MLRLWPFLAVLLLQLHGGVHGYMIDQDCGDDTQFIQDRIDAAFRLIDNTVTELNKNPINTQIDDWHNTLFGRRYDATAESHRNTKTRFEYLQRLRNRNDNDQTALHQGISDVRFYCTFKRVEKKEGKYINKDRNIVYKPTDLTSRFAHCYDLSPPTLMITFTVPGLYSEIQICPWFLTNVRGYKLKDLASLGSSFYHLISKVVVPVVAKTVYTPIDSFALMDKTIVHELTHTDQLVQPTVDVEPKPYGFKNAQNIVSAYLKDNRQPDPFHNADSSSLFAVGTWIIAKGGGPINADGTFGAPQATPKARI